MLLEITSLTADSSPSVRAAASRFYMAYSKCIRALGIYVLFPSFASSRSTALENATKALATVVNDKYLTFLKDFIF